MNRESYIKREFTEMRLEPENMLLYIVRNSIVNSIKCQSIKFKGKILDVGCGIMPYKEIILQNLEVVEYLGLDVKEAKYFDGFTADVFWDGTTIPFERNSFDTVIATEFLEHYFDTSSVLKEMNRVLNKGGILYGTVPFIWNLHELPYDQYRFTPCSLKTHLENAGFINIEILPLGGMHLAMGQMLGLWFTFSKIKNRWFWRRIVFVFYKWLVKKDKLFTSFDTGNNSLFNGLSFLAYKG
jgi:SAM-dependent methyltransferase